MVFGAADCNAMWAARTGVRHLHHLVGAGAMVYMAVAMAASTGRGTGTAVRASPC
ncbi:hypothetical protein GCM10023238_31630 [Streptomyces heliomycini]